MKKLLLQPVLILMFTSVLTISIGCGSTKSAAVLDAASPLMSALGSNPNLSTVTGLLKSPEIQKLLGGALKKPFTLLAPTNSAFDALGADALANLTKPENITQLTSLLKNHLVAGKLDATSIMKDGLNTIGGSPLNLSGVNLGSVINSDIANIIPIDKLLK